MKVIIAGSRGIDDPAEIFAAMVQANREGIEPTEIVTGCARGADKLGIFWARLEKLPIKRFPADWDCYGKAAGHIRNEAMAKYADALVLVWNGRSPGSQSMLQLATHYKLKIHTRIV